MEALGLTQEKQDELKDAIQEALRKAKFSRVELTEDKIEGVTQKLFGREMNIPPELEEKIRQLEDKDITDQDIEELKQTLKDTVDVGAITRVMLGFEKEEVEATKTEKALADLAKDSNLQPVPPLSEAIPLTPRPLASDIPQTKKGEAKKDPKAIETNFNWGKLQGQLDNLSTLLYQAIEAHNLDEEKATEEIVAKIADNEKELTKFLFTPIRPIALYFRLKNLNEDLKKFRGILRKRRDERGRRENEYDFAALMIRKIGETVKVIRKAENRAEYRASRIREREDHFDKAVEAKGSRQVGRALHEASRDVTKAAVHAEGLDAKLNAKATRREAGERETDIWFGGREAAKQGRFDRSMSKLQQKRDYYQNELNLKKALDNMGKQHKVGYKDQVRDGRTNFLEKNREDKHEVKKEKKYDKYKKKIAKLDERLANKKARWDAILENRKRRRRGETKEDVRKKAEQAAANLDFKKSDAFVMTNGPARDFDRTGYKFNAVDKRSLDALRNYRKLEGAMSPEELEHMEDSQEAIYRHFLNPAFMLFIKGREEKIDPILLTTIQKPYDFRYGTSREGIIEIKKSGTGSENIPDNFLIRLDKGNITQVRAGEVDEVLEAKNPREPLPWIGAGEYNERINNYTNRYSHAYEQLAPQVEIELAKFPEEEREERRADILSKILTANMDAQTKEIYETNNFTFIGKLKSLIEARNLDVELSHPYYQVINRLANEVGQKKEEAYYLYQDPGQKVYVLKDINEPYAPLAAFSLEGYFLQKDAKGNWKRADLYDNILKKEYEKTDIFRGKREHKLADPFKGAEKVKAEKEAFLLSETLKMINSRVETASDLQLQQLIWTLYPQTSLEYVQNIYDSENKQQVLDWMRDELTNNAKNYSAEKAKVMATVLGMEVALPESEKADPKHLALIDARVETASDLQLQQLIWTLYPQTSLEYVQNIYDPEKKQQILDWMHSELTTNAKDYSAEQARTMASIFEIDLSGQTAKNPLPQPAESGDVEPAAPEPQDPSDVTPQTETPAEPEAQPAEPNPAESVELPNVTN